MDEILDGIYERLDNLEKDIKGIEDFLTKHKTTLGEAFPEQQHRKAKEQSKVISRPENSQVI